MNIFTLTLLLLAVGGALFYFAVPMLTWTVSCAAVLFVLQYLGALGLLSWIIWPLFIAGAVFLNLPNLRRTYLTPKIFHAFRKVLPPMSDTEEKAIEAGQTWWEAEIFRGRPNWENLTEYAKPKLSPEEQSFVDNQVENLCAMLDDWHITHEAYDLPEKAWQVIKDERFFGMIIPKEYGGLGFTPTAHSEVITKIATRSSTAAITVMVPNSLGPAELLLKYGTDAQKNHYLPRLAKGEDIPCFALTGPEAGSDAGGLPDQGIICKDVFNGKETLGIRLNWDKRYITLAPVATLIGVAFKLYDPEHLYSDKEELGITLALIPSDTKGVESGDRHFPLNIPFMNGPTRGHDVFIPFEYIIGGEACFGQGWQMLMECLSEGRGISLPALSTACAQLSYRTTGAYAKIRRQFNTSIGHFEGVQEKMAEIAGFTYILEATRLMTTTALDNGIRPSIASAISKYHMTELTRKIVNNAMDVHGGKGIILGPTNYLGRAYQGMPISITVEGANILTRNLIIFGQGAFRCHPYVHQEVKAAKLFDTDPDAALVNFDKALFAHMGYSITNAVRSFVSGLCRGRNIRIKADSTAKAYLQKVTWLSRGLSLIADISMLVMGGELKRKERISARMGDVLSYLYLASSVYRHYEQNEKSEYDKQIIRWTLTWSLWQANVAFDGFFDNFPNKVIGKLLKFVIFPLGSGLKEPDDELSKQVSLAMMQPSEFRDRLTHCCYLGEGLEDPTGHIELAFEKLGVAEPYLKRIQQAVKEGQISKDLSFDAKINVALNKNIIDEVHAKALQEYEVARLKAINVDEFSGDYFRGNNAKWKAKHINVQTG